MLETNSLKSLKQEAEVNSCDDQVWLRLARACYQQANWEEAIAAYDRAIDMRHQYSAENYDPSNILVTSSPNISNSNEDSSNSLDEAFTYFQETLEIESEYAVFYLHYGYFLRDQLALLGLRGLMYNEAQR